MATYKIKGFVTASNIRTLENLIAKTFPGGSVSVEKEKRNMSRADRLAEAESQTEDAKSVVEELRDELQSWYDNLPENFQQGDKGSQLEEAIQALEEILDGFEQMDFSSVDFPSMMG